MLIVFESDIELVSDLNLSNQPYLHYPYCMGKYCIGDAVVSEIPAEPLNSHCSGNSYRDLVCLWVVLIGEQLAGNDVVSPYRNIHCFDSPLFGYNMRSADLLDNFHRRDVSEYDRHVENLENIIVLRQHCKVKRNSVFLT